MDVLFTDFASRSAGSPLTVSQKITSLSYSFAYQAKAGLYYRISFFGDEPSLIRQHEIEQVKHLVSVYNGNVIIVLHAPLRTLKMEEVLSNVETAFGKHIQMGTYAVVRGTARLSKL
jgi:hypothetical protein